MDDILKNIFRQINDLNRKIDNLESILRNHNLIDKEEDILLPQAINIVQEYDRAAASLLQRRLKIGYARAARLIDQLEEKGVIAPGEGAKPRKVIKKQS